MDTPGPNDSENSSKNGDQCDGLENRVEECDADTQETDERDPLYSKKDLLETVGIESRTLAYWITKRIQPTPILYTGQGRQGFFSHQQVQNAIAIDLLSSNYDQSIKDIKQIKVQLQRSLKECSPLYEDAYLGALLELHSYSDYDPDFASLIEEIKVGKKTLKYNDAGLLEVIITKYQKDRYITHNNRVCVQLTDDEFRSYLYISMKQLPDYFKYSQEKEKNYKTAINYQQRQSEFTEYIYPHIEYNFELGIYSHKNVIELIDSGIIYHPPYFYKNDFYYHVARLHYTVKPILYFCHILGYSLEKTKLLSDRIREDISLFHHSPDAESEKYCYESSTFFKTIDQYSRCIEHILECSRALFDISLPNRISYIKSFKPLLDLYLKGVVRIMPNPMDDSLLFNIVPLELATMDQITELIKAEIYSEEEIKEYLTEWSNEFRLKQKWLDGDYEA